MVRFAAFALLAIAAVCSVTGQASNDDPNGKVLYVNYPSCAYYQCKVTWRRGQKVYINWLNAPKGGLKIQLGPQEGVKGLSTHTVVKETSSIKNQKLCDHAGTKESCGRYYWTVPDDIKLGSYQIIVTSIAKPNIVGYTDTVQVTKKSSKSKRHDTNRLDDDHEEEAEEDDDDEE